MFRCAFPLVGNRNHWGHPANIAVDITGGKKSMVGGAAMAGAALGANIYSVDNTSLQVALIIQSLV